MLWEKCSKINFVIVANNDDYGHRCGSNSVCVTFVGVSIGSLFLSLVGNLLGMEASANSRRALHDDLVKGLLRKATHDNVHFETSILSRISTDVAVIDTKILSCLQRLALVGLVCLSSLVVMAVQAPCTMAVAIPLTIVYWVVQSFYRKSGSYSHPSSFTLQLHGAML